MALDKLVDSTQLDSDLTSVANAIRTKSGGSSQLAFPNGFVSEIQSISPGTSISPYTSNPAALGTASPGSSDDYSRGDHVHAMPSASDVGAAPAVTEVTVSTAGDVTQALNPGVIYHFTGAISSLTLTLTAVSAGQIAQYHFDFNSGSTAATISLTGVNWQGGSFAPAASKHYEVDILNGYGVVCEW